MTYLITGAAGFIGARLSLKLLQEGKTVIGVDNLNDYYDVSLKHHRLLTLTSYPNFIFHQADIADRVAMEALAQQCYSTLTHMIHLAAQAGVRYSLENPYAYLQSNLAGQLVMLEMARHAPKLEHFIYASSSSVYGSNIPPYSTHQRTDTPVSLYAATKKSGEMLAHSYHHLYGFPATGLRFFTVYGEAGRPDMAYFSFTKAILEGKHIKLYNYGKMQRDFTYIDDIVQGIIGVIDLDHHEHRIYNLGNATPVALEYFVDVLEHAIGKKAERILTEMQDGDVEATAADIADSTRDFGFQPNTPIEVGLPKFVSWYKNFYA